MMYAPSTQEVDKNHQKTNVSLKKKDYKKRTFTCFVIHMMSELRIKETVTI